MSIARFEPGETIVRQGEPTRRLFLIASGTVRVLLGNGEQAQQVARLERGAWIGETALLTGSVVVDDRSGRDRRADADDRARRLPRGGEDGPVACSARLATELAGRLRSSNDLLEGGPRASHRRAAARGRRTASTRRGRPRRASAGRRRRSWRSASAVATTRGIASRTTSRIRCGSSGCDERLDARRLRASIAPTARRTTISRALLRALAEFAPLVIVAGGETRAPSDGAHHGSAVADRARCARVRAAGGAVPHETYRVGRAFDADAVARRICRQRIGLALGGGAARGFAHLGVLQALAEASMPIDVLTGASIGAAVAAGVAMGQPLRRARRDDRVDGALGGRAAPAAGPRAVHRHVPGDAAQAAASRAAASKSSAACSGSRRWTSTRPKR